MSKLRYLFDRLLLIPALILVIGPVQTAAAAVAGDFYVSGVGDDMTGDGSESNPWRTITHAVVASGGGAPTIHVGAGLYNSLNGESFPIAIDAVDDTGLSVIGPGDGSAVVVAATLPPLIAGVPASDEVAFLDASDYIAGEVLVSGLTIEGGTDSSSCPFCPLQLGGDSAMVLYLPDGASAITLLDNDVSNHGLVTIHPYWSSSSEVVPPDHSVLIEGNSVSNYEGTGVYLSLYASSSATVQGPMQIDWTVRNNTFVDVSRPVDFTFGIDSMSAELSVDWTIEGNYMEGGYGVEMYASFGADFDEGYEPEITLDAEYNVTIRDNDFVDVSAAVSEFLFVEYFADLKKTLVVSNNLISMGEEGYAGIDISSSVDTSIAYVADVLVSGNDIEGGSYGIEIGYTVDYENSVVDRDVLILDNRIVDVEDTGIYLYTSVNQTGQVAEHDISVVGNTIIGDGDGLALYASIDSSNQSSSYSIEILNNHIAVSESPVQMETSISGSTVYRSQSWRGNLIERSQAADPLFQGKDGGQPLIYWECEVFAPNGGGVNFGDAENYGFNTIRLDLVSGSSSSISVADEGDAVGSFVGNWWGTTDLLELEDYIFHGVDDPYYPVVDFSLPLSDAMTYSVSQPGKGSKVRLTAGDGSGFVPYAGELDISVTVDGVAAEEVTVADDYASLTFKNNYGGQEVEICVTNPGGQSGCVMATISEVKSGGGCGIIPVSGGMPTAKHLIEQYLLLLLPVLFFFRRRSRGHAETPTGLAAA